MLKTPFREDVPLVAFLLITAVAVLVYSNAFFSPFHFDDEANIVQNAALKDLGNFWPASGLRYVGYLSFALNYHFGKLNVFGYHLVNLTIHIFNGFLIWWLVFLTLKTPAMAGAGGLARHKGFMALAAALLFVAHPIQTQAVTYIVQRFTSLATLFYLLSLVMYIQARLIPFTLSPEFIEGSKGRSKSVLCYLIALLSAVLAMKTKEISFTLPLIIVLYEFTFLGNPGGEPRGLDFKRLLRLVPFVGTLLIIPLSFLKADGSAGEMFGDLGEAAKETKGISRGEYLLTQFHVLVTYIRLLFLPVNQNLDYDYPISRSLDVPVLLSLLFLLIILGTAVTLFTLSRQEGHRGLRLVAFGIFWFFITLSVESSVIPIRDVIFEHRLYLPSAGIALAFVSGLFYLFGFAKSKGSPFQVTSVLLLVMVIPLGIATYHRNVAWKEETTLWEDVVRKSPNKGRGYMELGGAYAKQGRLAEAQRQYMTAVELAPNYPIVHFNFGNFYHEQGRLKEAHQEFMIALSLAPNDPQVHYNLGVLYTTQGFWEKAYQEFLTAVKLAPNNPVAHYNFGNFYNKQGRLEEAYKEYLIALKLSPNNAQTHLNLGTLYDKQGRLAEAYREYKIALRLAPNDPKVHYNLGILYDKGGRLEEAYKEYGMAIKLSPNYTQAHLNLGTLYDRQGRLKEAYQEFMIALKLSPNDPKIHYNLGTLYDKQGRLEEAYKEYVTALRLAPNDAQTHINLGILFATQRRLRAAAGEFMIALRLTPEDPKVHYNLGVLYAAQGLWEKAYQEFRTALKLSPGDPVIHFTLGKVYRSQGKKKEAKKQFEMALKLKPSYRAAQQALQSL